MTGAEDLVNKVRAYHSGADARSAAYESRQVHRPASRASVLRPPGGVAA
jgi:hypothetical protein